MDTAWQDRALATIRDTEKIPLTTDRWSPSQPKQKAISQAQILVHKLASYDAAADPVIEPTIEGGIEFEWKIGARELNIAIAPEGTITLLQTENSQFCAEKPLEFAELGALFQWLANA